MFESFLRCRISTPDLDGYIYRLLLSSLMQVQEPPGQFLDLVGLITGLKYPCPNLLLSLVSLMNTKGLVGRRVDLTSEWPRNSTSPSSRRPLLFTLFNGCSVDTLDHPNQPLNFSSNTIMVVRFLQINFKDLGKALINLLSHFNNMSQRHGE